MEREDDMAVDNMEKSKRKPGGGRKPTKPDYNPSAILQNQMDVAVALYGKEERPSLQTIADELDLNPIKVRKLLITAGVYKSDAGGNQQRCSSASAPTTTTRQKTRVPTTSAPVWSLPG